MPIDIVFSLIGKASSIIFIITGRLDQIKQIGNNVSKVKEHLEYLQLTIKKIEPHLKKDADTEELEQFLTHLQNASKSCSDILEKHHSKIEKILKAGKMEDELKAIEEKIKAADSKLRLFMIANNLVMLGESTDFQNKKLNNNHNTNQFEDVRQHSNLQKDFQQVS